MIVGAGMGGLALALRLAHRGHRVTVLEKTDKVGGRNRPLQVNDCHFDSGPTLMMMREPFDRLFAAVGERLEDHLSLLKLDPSYRVFYKDGTRLEGSPNEECMARTITEAFGANEADGFHRLLKDLKAMYEVAIPRFVARNFKSPLDFGGPAALAAVLRHRMVSNYARRLESYFKDPKLRMLFSFQTLYLGLSPFEAPWVYAVLAYMEYGEGIWYPQGGIVRLAEVIADLARQRGAEIRLGSPVRQIAARRAILESGEELEADAIIVNADLPYAERDLLLLPQPKARKPSCSALVLCMDYDGELPELLHHNVFFSGDYRANLDEVFTKRIPSKDPSFYAAVSRRTDPSKAPAGHENLMILLPCPVLDRRWTPDDESAARQRIFGRLSAEVGFDSKCVAALKSYGPNEHAEELNLDRGAAFGLSHHFSQSAFFRPANRSRHNPNVYFVGASTVPGNGLPMVLISAELAEQRLEQEGHL